MATPIYIHIGDQSGENRQGGDEIDIMDLGSGSDTAGGGGNFNIILGGGNADYLRSEGVFEDIFGGSGNDTIIATGYGGWLFGGSGDDTITGSDNDWRLPEHIFGGSGDDTIDGGGGDDLIIGGAGDDDLTGGAGADTFVFWEGHGADTIRDFNFAEGDRIHLTNFDKTITWAHLNSKITSVTDENGVVTGVQIDLSEWGGGTIILNGITSVDDVTEDMFVLDRIVGSDGTDDFLQGGTSDDTMSGGTGSDIIIGGAGDDTIDGGAGQDFIIDGAGDDTMTGGTDADTFFFFEGHGDDTITDFSKADGDKIVLSGFGAAITWDALSTNITTVADDNNVVTGIRIDLGEWGGGTITLEGITSVDDVTEDMFVLHALTGSDGVDDTLTGGAGDDTMTGGTGADTFVFKEDSGKDTITDFDTGNDKIDLSGFDAAITWGELSARITTVTDDGNEVTGVQIDLGYWGGGMITLEGIMSVDDITEEMFDLPDGSTTSRFGTENANMIDGGGGGDIIYGMEGDDTLRGEGGGDMIFGGEGDDWLEGGTGDDLLMGGEGHDVLIGDEGDDLLVGGEGDDVLMGGGGTDTFVFNQDSGHDTITDFNVGIDKIDLSAFTDITSPGDLHGYQAGDDAVIFLGFNDGGSITLKGVQLSDLESSDFILYQSEYTGTADADTLTGGVGDDTITGLAGDDTLDGGEGADTFVFAPGHGNDTITDFADGKDMIDLSAFSGISAFGDLAFTAVGSDVEIDLSEYGGGTITLQNFTLNNLDAADFVFHQEEQQDGI